MTFNLNFYSLLKTISLEAVNIMNSFDVKTVELKVKTLVHVPGSIYLVLHIPILKSIIAHTVNDNLPDYIPASKYKQSKSN